MLSCEVLDRKAVKLANIFINEVMNKINFIYSVVG
ncbi:Hypothetical protein CpCP13_0618 [Corynebacterium pseudotuberculosis]|nr:Hypothetical protein CpPAT10_0605a [Corynebacterium pseudotuberculosis PAT10]AFF21760.1 Hypothetical protein CpP54B96_0615 [Corynebacterium pseudotuberculosis P54B96]AFH51534.1 Hypothetical protein Cp267_0631 [Corynebacterium pseudotuberculosis 267]AJC13342.1 hypothetical protein CpVD57_0619 [Corynebacterium pseudotuberculosis]AKJ55277.1 Hypothetical protein Cp12C_0643 [Corynebacterium pseudotuberculosis]